MASKKSVSTISGDSSNGTPPIHSTSVGGAVSIDIRGARGPNAVTINGIYDPTDELCNDWPVYQKRGDSNKWLEFFNQSNKWYIKATNDRGKARGWMRLNSSNAQTGVMVNRPELCKEVSEVWDGSKWTSQPSVTIVTARQRHQDDIRSGTLRRLRAVPVCISGATGPSGPSINGIYEPTDEICGGWPVYRKKENVQSSSGLSSSLPDSEKWLEYIVATNEWYVKPTTDKGKAEGWMCIGNSVISSSVFGELNNPYCNLHQSGGAMRPELSKGTCDVWDGERWTTQNTVQIVPVKPPFDSMSDLQLFCYEEIKRLEDKFRATLLRTLPIVQNNINIPNVEKRVEEGVQQLLGVSGEIEAKIARLQEQRSKAVKPQPPPPPPQHQQQQQQQQQQQSQAHSQAPSQQPHQTTQQQQQQQHNSNGQGKGKGKNGKKDDETLRANSKK